jgi:hypothetical protein
MKNNNDKWSPEDIYNRIFGQVAQQCHPVAVQAWMQYRGVVFKDEKNGFIPPQTEVISDLVVENVWEYAYRFYPFPENYYGVSAEFSYKSSDVDCKCGTHLQYNSETGMYELDFVIEYIDFELEEVTNYSFKEDLTRLVALN